MEPFGPVRLLVLQPTPFCNLDCDYCYLPDRGNRSRLSFELLEAALERVLESPFFDGGFTLLWHAGSRSPCRSPSTTRPRPGSGACWNAMACRPPPWRSRCRPTPP